jgi:hypothetical protein
MREKELPNASIIKFTTMDSVFFDKNTPAPFRQSTQTAVNKRHRMRPAHAG